MVDVICPVCNSQNRMMLKDEVFNGPFVCWKCKTKMMLSIEAQRVVSCEPIEDDEYKCELKSNSINQRYV